MSIKIRQLSKTDRTIQRSAVEIKGATVALTEEVKRRAVGRHYRAAVFTIMRGEVKVLTGGGVIAPDVAGNRRSVVFAPLILKALDVFVYKAIALRYNADILGRGGENLTDFTSVNRHGIHFGLRAGWK